MGKHKTSLAEALGHPQADKRLDILRRVAQAGSISEAARSAGVSYKAAWQAIENLGNLAGTALVEKAVGGSGGGGARLTPAGAQLLQAAAQMQAARRSLQKDLEQKQAGGLALLSLRTSMRNQFPATVQSLKRHQGFLRVALALAEGTLLHARITRESAELLDLVPGLAVLLLCKATAVTVAPALDVRPGCNLLHGSVTRATPRSREVAVQFAAGLQLVGFAAEGHGLKPGASAMAWIEEAAVVIAITG